MLAWRQEQPICGIVLRSNVEKFELHVFRGPPEVNPRAGFADEWRRVGKFDEQVVSLADKEKLRWIRFSAPVGARGLRVTMLRTSEGPIASVSGLHALVDFGAAGPGSRTAGR